MKSNGRDGYAKFRSLIENAMSVVEYRIEKLAQNIDTSTDSGKIKFLESAADILSRVNSPIEREVYATRLAEKYSITKDAILKLAADDSRKNRQRIEKQKQREITRPRREDRINIEKPRNMRAANAEEGLISVLMRNPDFIKSVSKVVLSEDFVTAFNRKLYDVIVKRQSEGNSIDFITLNSDFSSEEMERIAEIASKGAERANTLEECAVCAEIMRQEKLKLSTNLEDTQSDSDFAEMINKIKNNKLKGVKNNGN